MKLDIHRRYRIIVWSLEDAKTAPYFWYILDNISKTIKIHIKWSNKNSKFTLEIWFVFAPETLR